MSKPLVIDCEIPAAEIKFGTPSQTYPVKWPSQDDVKMFQGKAKELKDDDMDGAMELMREFYEPLGLPRKVVSKMPLKHLETLQKHLFDAKKN